MRSDRWITVDATFCDHCGFMMDDGPAINRRLPDDDPDDEGRFYCGTGCAPGGADCDPPPWVRAWFGEPVPDDDGGLTMHPA